MLSRQIFPDRVKYVIILGVIYHFFRGDRMEILNNAWVVGIGGGILSGLIVTWISRIMFSKKENSIYVQNLQSANNEVIYALRPAISENKFPSVEIISALIEANSRKFKVKRQDMYNIKQLAEELTKEIMDTSFISYDKKDALFQHLVDLYNEEEVIEIKENVIVRSDLEVQEYKKRLLNRVTIMLGFMTTIVFFMSTMFSYYNSIFNSIRAQSFIVLPIYLFILMLVVLAIVLFIADLERLVKKKKVKENIKININSNNNENS